MKDKAIMIRLEAELRDTLLMKAEKEERSLSGMIRKILKEWLHDNDKAKARIK